MGNDKETIIGQGINTGQIEKKSEREEVTKLESKIILRFSLS